jgi:hypothetical protein
MQVDTNWKPGASDRERSAREHGSWVVRPHGTRARDNRSREARSWQAEARDEVEALGLAMVGGAR